ncbi:TetR/AcrR family transcriptional regulator [Xanthovirga aplysinae]|uniref:TetR/AcrR family transcriptional regulator n=1 Tax=Xanthovirga aplysinae TaxID=2529853 RepID=UPI0012BB8B29|nr:TetR/AcrR family transcriptional regulator [Xanthovirga aplysinae]MTI30120.1 TetR/AcrR family transcriptional regulator [Xanthovirga aplysinae]
MRPRSEDKKQAILAVTLDLISENGFHGTPMSMVAKEAKVGIGTIYRYFENKEDLINELYRIERNKANSAMLLNYTDNLKDKEKFRLIWINLCNYYLYHPKEFKFLEQYAYSPFLKGVNIESFPKIIEPIVDYFRQLKMTNKLKDLSMEFIFSLSFSPIISLVDKHLAGRVVLTQEEMEKTLNSCWDSVSN